MRPRRACCFSILLAGLVQAQSGGLGPGRSGPFRHPAHVPRAWADWSLRENQFVHEELQLDCLGCHESENPTRIAKGLCERCHYGGFRSAGERKGKDEAAALFRHADHARNLFCRHCHSPRDSAGQVEKLGQVPPHMAVFGGTKSCLACHGPQASDLYPKVIAPERNDPVLKAAEEKLVGVLARLNASGVMAPRSYAAGEGFRHADHLAGWPGAFSAKASERPAGSCLPCHEAAARSISPCEALAAAGKGAPAQAGAGEAIGERVFGPEACGGCHVSLAGGGPATAPRPFDVRRRAWKSSTAGTFSHADHLRRAPSGGDPADMVKARGGIQKDGCFSCHALDDPAAPVTFALERRFLEKTARASSYDACAACHESWSVESRAARIRGVREEPPHAEISRDTKRCAKCHRLGFLTKMDDLPAKVTVKRPRGAELVISTHAHEFITSKEALEGEKAKVSEECSKVCHRSDLKEQPSRIRKSRFNHSTHLPRDAKPEDCEACHSKVKESGGPEAIGSEKLPLYDKAACEKCHKGAPAPAEAKKEPDEIAAPLFAHADHVGKRLPGGEVVTCVRCHRGKVPDGEPAVGILDAAKDCRSCHSHEKAPQITGKVSGAWVATCLRCHKTGVPESSAELPADERVFVAGAADRQFHPDPKARPCSECHAVALDAPAAIRREAPDFISADGFWRGAPGVAAGKTRFHEANRALEAALARDAKRFGDEDCMCCHWAQQGEGDQQYRWPPAALAAGRTLDLRRDKVNDLYKQLFLSGKYPGTPCCK